MRSILVVMVTLASAFSLWAQGERGTITGTVTDSSGAIVPRASVTLRNTGTNIRTQVETNSSGIYVFPALNPGSYDLAIEAPGFRPRRVSNIPLSTGLTATIDAVLEVGQVSEAVEVQAAAVQLEAQSSSLSKTVETRRVVELPLLGRNPLQLAALAPGVIPSRGQQGAGGDAIGQAANSRISGGLAMQNAILMDGGDSRGFTSGGQAYAFPIESVAEFKVETSSYSAEFGRSAGGVISVASRSGTNQLHGVVYDFIRSQALNANSWSNNRNRVARQPFQYNQFGGALGGKIIRDRTFYFLNYEGLRQGSPRNFLATVPLPQWRNGDFRNTFDRAGAQVTVYDPTTTRADPNNPGRFVRSAFPNNQIPANRIHPISNNLMKYWPEANRPGEGAAQVNNFFLSGKNVTNQDNWFARVDHQISSKHRIFGRFAGRQSESFPLGLVEAAFPATSVSTNPVRNAGISVTSTFSPNLLGEFRVSYTRLQNNSRPVSEGFDLASVGFPQTLANAVTYRQFPQIQVQQYATGSGLAVATFGSTEVSNLGGTGRDLLPQDTWHTQYQTTWLRGRHKWKFGVDLQRMKMAAFNSRLSGGQFNFDRTYTQGPDPSVTSSTGGNGFASFLLGIPLSGSLDTTPSMMLFQRYNAAYIQDDWRVTSRLTLNLGLRYEFISPYAEKFGQIGYMDARATEPVTGLPGVFRWSKPGEYHHDPFYKGFWPRVGIAYQLTSKTVIRTGGGIFSAANNGLNAAASDFGSGLFVNNSLSLGPQNPILFTPPVGGSWSNPFAAGLVFPVKGESTFVGQNIRVEFRDRAPTYVAMWNFNVQHQLSNNLLAEVGYSGSKTTNLFWNRFDNANDPLLLGQWGSRLLEQVPNPFFGRIQGGVGAFPTVQRRQLLRPFPQYQQVLAIRRPYADGHYQSMIARVEKTFSHGYTISAGYTLSKLIAETAESNTWLIGPSNALYDPAYNRHVEGNDAPQRLVISHLYELPFGVGKRYLNDKVFGRILGGWQFSGITVLQSGRPLLISAPDTTGLLEFSYTNGRANRLRSAVLDNPTKEKWFDTSAFATAPAFTVPTDSLSQPDLRTPGRTAFNWSFTKNTPIKERMALQFRFEMFNVFNNPQFDVRGASTDLTNPQFGQITEGGGERNIQLGLRLSF